MSVATPVVNEELPREVVLISHSPIFYWWPVWLVGFLMAGLTYLSGQQMAIVPLGTVAEQARTVAGHEGARDILIAPLGLPLPLDRKTEMLMQPTNRMTASNNPGVIFAITLGLVIVITNIHLRGLWSVIVVLGIALASVLLATLGWWDAILKALGWIDIHINASGYFSLALFLFVIWAGTYLIYDRRSRIIFSRGQLRIREAVGSGEATFDTLGMVVEKHRDDVFRHWLLGFGSGDLTVRTSGANTRQIEVHNVMRADRKLALIRRMLQEREVVGGRS
ncbi:hypothetical protein EP7_000352 [Isosphaeraceae bacterium EP7]